MQSASGSSTSVHIGCFTGDYNAIQSRDIEQIPSYGSTGLAASILANRISWFFNFNGPSVMVDTACSSSLVALDQACQALRNGQSTMVSQTNYFEYSHRSN